MKLKKSYIFTLLFTGLFFSPVLAFAETDFNPHNIISDQELQDYLSWEKSDIQKFLDDKGSSLSNFLCADASGTVKTATDIIYDAAQNYKINPKFLLTTLQKEQSLITDDTPTQRQLDWATGYAACDGCNLDDTRVAKYKGFGKQVDGAAGIMRWYYDNENQSFIKKKDTPIRIDNTDVTPQSWATAFLYTYTPHLHGNKNFWRIWNTWFEQVYPDGTLFKSASTSEYWLVQNGERRKFKNKTALITRTDPKKAVVIPDIDLANYKIGSDIAFPNYSILRSPAGIYLLDYDTIRPFASEDVVAKLGYNPQEVIDVETTDITSYSLGTTITATSTAPQGVIYQITDLPNTYYLLKENILHPIIDKKIVDTDYYNLPVEKHKQKELSAFETATIPLKFKDGTLLRAKDSTTIYVVEKGQKRAVADEETFKTMGYRKANVITVDFLTLASLPTGETLFVNTSLTSSRNKFLGDSTAPVADLYPTAISPSYLVAEYPSGRIISGKNIDTVRPIASLTKLLTAYEALHQDYNVNNFTVYDKKSLSGNPSAKGLQFKQGEKIKNQDVFAAMLVVSNNTAARLVAAGTNLSEVIFIQKINDRLSEWGADNTAISDVTGLDEHNISSARDLLKIFTRVLGNTTIATALGQKTYPFKGQLGKKTLAVTLHNTNEILTKIPTSKRHYNIIATKTGYTEEADSTLTMLIESKTTKQKYVIITLGNPLYARRFEEPHKLAEWISLNAKSIAETKVAINNN